MLKLCVIGNSHVACFKSGWAAIAQYFPDVELTIYPFHGLFYDSFTPVPDEGILRTEKDMIRNRFIHLLGGDGHIRVSEFDACLIIGGTRPLSASLERFSRQVRRATIIDWFDHSHINMLVQKIRVLSDLPINIAFNPLLAFKDPSENPVTNIDFQGTMNVLKDYLPASRGVRVFVQPEQTIQGAFGSKLEYATGERLSNASVLPGATPVVEYDLMHMNSAFGALFLSEILASRGFCPEDLKLPKPDGHLSLAARAALTGGTGAGGR